MDTTKTTSDLVLDYLNRIYADEDCMCIANEMHGHDEDIECDPDLTAALMLVIEHIKKNVSRHGSSWNEYISDQQLLSDAELLSDMEPKPNIGGNGAFKKTK